MAPAYQRDRRRLGEALRALRAAAGLSQPQFAAALTGLGGPRWGQSKVSRIETGDQLPADEGELAAWIAAAGAGPDVLDMLAGLLRAARVEYAALSAAYRQAGGADQFQADLAELEARSARIAEFQPAIISGLLQTAEYATGLLHLPCGPASYGRDEDEIAQMVAARQLRQRQAIYTPGRRERTQVVMLEAALTSRVVPAGVLAAQLTWLISVAGMPSLELGVIAEDAPVPVWPLGGFRLYDDLVIEETIEGENQVSDPEVVARYVKDFGLLREAAALGRDAVPVISRALDRIRR